MREPAIPHNPAADPERLTAPAAKGLIRRRLGRSTLSAMAAFGLAIGIGVGSAELAEAGHDNAAITLELGGIAAIAAASVIEGQLARAKCEGIVNSLNQTGNPNAGHETVALSVRSGELEHGTTVNERAVPVGTNWERTTQPLFTTLGSFFVWASAGESVQPGAEVSVGVIGAALFAVGGATTIYNAWTNRQNTQAYFTQIDTLANGPQILFEQPPDDRS